MMHQPHLCPACQAEFATFFCVGCRTTACAADAVKHYEEGADNQLIPVDEIIRAFCFSINFIEIMHALLKHTLVHPSEELLKEMDNQKQNISRMQTAVTEKLKKGHVQAAWSSFLPLQAVSNMLILIATTQIHDEQVHDLIYRLNLQRRGNQRGIMGG